MLGSITMLEFPLTSLAFTGRPSLLAAADLAFNPVRLAALIGWVYLCVYLAQRTYFSPLVPKKYKPAANVVTLFTGPFLLLALFLIDAARKARGTEESFFAVLHRQMRQVLATLHAERPEAEEDSALRLLDTSGRSLDEICGHTDAGHEDARVLDLTETTIADALDRRASDILIDPKDASTYTIRLRVDGTLRVAREVHSDVCRSIINSLKAVAGMDISERRRPQDGGFLARKGTMTASFRVASAGALHGEKLSIRVLNKDAGAFTLAHVGLTEKQYALVQGQIARPAGMILICGPTGSGKTTTMYAMLNEIDRFTRNVITVEDPIEAVLPQASQIEINPKAEITFAAALRSVLRQDPDVICVGEIRDEETAEIALRAAQTGHLVLATLHAENSATALIRLLDLGISPLLLSAGLNLVFTQRLVRRLCEHCREPAHLSDSRIEEFQRKHIDTAHLFEAVGCKHCSQTGYAGRTAICDLMLIDDAFKARIATSDALLDQLRIEGTQSQAGLRKHGLKKAVAGITTLEEIKRVVG
ncbi:MAG: GspE/PulE family protein [Planctomycetes bacterium]|jgi:type II secretory ATPase GspE/PulE/Tfp pilus assembly ATPase PilB-like protein|nr:GspE/PulE family protein [Planctomycetota bacterium]